MTKESEIRLITCKLQSYRNGYWRARAEKDDAAAEKWKEGFRAIQGRIDELKQE